jgi:hypothetical protein
LHDQVVPSTVDQHRLLLGPGAARAWDRRIASLPEPDGATVVLVGALCHEDDVDAALVRMRHDLPDGGRVVFVEHVGRPGLRGRLERTYGDAVARFPWGCHVGRDIPAALRRAGFLITDLERFTMPTPNPLLRSWVSGIAIRRHA